MFIRDGHKKKAVRLVADSVVSAKLRIKEPKLNGVSLLHILMRKLNPFFKLRPYKLRNGRSMVRYPVATKVERLYTKVLIRLKKFALRKYNKRKYRGFVIRSFTNVLSNTLVDAISPKNNELVYWRRVDVKQALYLMKNKYRARIGKRRKKKIIN